ncbi:hypothetical protein N7462_000891 [Penicillium macrosclerotiorum]|uniref:uncharacterized protein n=1 Tax=Penicillium macrosclerotiorum TaxID=303699 RepID=UPI002548ED12|nr:uncharacterized protein N7462_000891 [Penicillium macrosclerotiorum]KAJ5698886.1 hypothetical protein N7462_000891 [Penicillium macrosclerotiorum]
MAGQKILMITHSELGQATIVLSVAHELLLRGCDVHIASFNALSRPVEEMNARAALLSDGPAKSATFHPVDGLSMAETYTKRWSESVFPTHLPGYDGVLDAFKTKSGKLMACWTGPEYMKAHDSIVTIIKEIQPTLITVDSLFYQSIDACRTAGREFTILSANSLKDHVFQPWLATLWKYPFSGSGFPFPIPWRFFFKNIYLAIQVAIIYPKFPALKDLNTYRNEHGIPGPLATWETLQDKNIPYIIACSPEIDFPCQITEQFTTCGPILRPFRSIAVESPSLATWLAKAPTVLINLGSHLLTDTENMKQYIEAIQTLLDCRSDVQVLWKMKTLAGTDFKLEDFVDDSFTQRVRTESWLNADPACILESGNVVCMVHHGGANSYNEAVWAGVPHIVLPVWFDTYDFASRVEYHGIGVWGSKKSAPKINGKEFGEAFRRVLASEESETIRNKALALRNQLSPIPGRVMACEKILKLCGDHTDKTK